MAGSESITCEVPKQISDQQLERKLNETWQQLVSELDALPGSMGVKLSDSERNSLESKKIQVQYEGAGFDPATITLIISLAPVIQALVPLLEPFSKDASDVAHKVALDIWDLLKQKLWEREHISLKQR